MSSILIVGQSALPRMEPLLHPVLLINGARNGKKHSKTAVVGNVAKRGVRVALVIVIKNGGGKITTGVVSFRDLAIVRQENIGMLQKKWIRTTTQYHILDMI